jgi:hypothetical protein
MTGGQALLTKHAHTSEQSIPIEHGEGYRSRALIHLADGLENRNRVLEVTNMKNWDE